MPTDDERRIAELRALTRLNGEVDAAMTELVADVDSAEPEIIVPARVARAVVEAVDYTFHMLGLIAMHDAWWDSTPHNVATDDAVVALAESGTGMVRDWLRDRGVPLLAFWYPSQLAKDWVSVAWRPSN